MFPRILTAQRGQVLVQDHKDYDSERKESVARDLQSVSTITCYSYNPSTAKFVGCADCDFNVAAKQILTCSVIEDIGTGTVLPCFLIEVGGRVNDATHKSSSRELDVTSYEYQVLLFIQEKGKVMKACSFSTFIPLSKCEVWLLNGPTICWVCDGSLNVVRVKSDKPTIVSTEKMSNHMWNSKLSLKWCDVISGDLIAMTTYPVLKEETSTSNMWFEDLTSQRKWMILHFPNGDIHEGHITEMTKVPVIPNAYASIINSVYIESRDIIVHSKDVILSSDISVLAATNQKQLLEFCRGRVEHVCDLPFGDACKILTAARMEGGDLVMVKSESGTVCAVERRTFKMLQQWEDISTILVDDFLFSGSEQVLMIPEDPNKTHPLQGFILTDLDTCYVNDKDSGADEVTGESKTVCNENLLSAIRALETRLQSGTASLREVETRCDERIKLIEQSQHALHKMVNGQENNLATNYQGHLLCMYGSIHHQDVGTSGVSMVNGDKEVRVFKGWQRVVDTAWVVGVTIHNKTDSTMEEISLSLIPISAGSNICIHMEREPLTSECRVVFASSANLFSKTLSKQTKLIDPTEPKTKKRKLNYKSLEDRSVCLSPGEHADVVAIATVPDLSAYPVICCDMVLQWKQQDYGNWVTKSGDIEHHWIERANSCGRVWLSASDVVKGVLGIELAPIKPRTTEQLNQDAQVLDAIQMSTALSVTSRHSNLNCILEALKCTMGFIPTAKHDGLVCPSVGVLWGIRVMLEIKDSSHGVLTVWTKDKNQLMLFYHSLYQLLPDDITIHPLCSPLNQMEQSITSSIQSMQQELTTQVGGVHDAQSEPTVLGQDADDIMDVDECKVTGEGSVVTEAAKKLLDVRSKFETDWLMLKDQGNDFTFDEERLRDLEVDVNDYQQKTDAAVRELTRNMMYNLQN